MQLIKTAATMQEEVEQTRLMGGRIGFVPTMGALHRGHLSLVKRAVKENTKTVVSVFVNPTQFGPREDFQEYPRNLAADMEKLAPYGIDWMFAPTVEEMYPEDYGTFVTVEGLTEQLCGHSRPGHFIGVTTIVCKLLNLVSPHRAYFGQKDGQQFLVIRKMVQDLNMGLEVVPCPTIREEDGLALSSRNAYLTAKEREAATILYQTLKAGESLIKKGERDTAGVKAFMEEKIKGEPLARIDYVAIVNRRTIEEEEKLAGPVMLALAVYLGKTRLIDNIWMEV